VNRAEQILDAAAQLFADRGVGSPGMEDVARAAGCSRATLYRHYDNKDAVLRAFVQREAAVILAEVGSPPNEVAAVVATLAAVRARPHLRIWYTQTEPAVLQDVLRESPLVPALADDRGRWILRIVMSFLREPGESVADERRLLERFLAPAEAVSPSARRDPRRRDRWHPSAGTGPG
jgi:AcrR family transcriptional regulator